MYDLVIRGGLVYDGSGSAPQIGDVAVKDGKIVAVGTVAEKGEREIDAKGLCVTPGFIDSHSHTDSSVFPNPGIPEVIEQGITTSVQGQCGTSTFPKSANGPEQDAKAFFDQLKAAKTGPNHVLLIGQGTLRRTIMGKRMDDPTPEEMAQMKKLLSDAMENGAAGMSLGLAYIPGQYTKMEELVELAKVVASYNGILVAHIRNESDQLIESVQEFLDIAKAAKVRGVISHFKACKERNHGKVVKTLAMVDKAWEEGYEIYGDVYPYTATSTALRSVFVTKEMLSLPDDVLVEELKKPEVRKELHDKIAPIHSEELDYVLVVNSKKTPQYEGKRISESAKEFGKAPYDVVYDILVENKMLGKACYFSIGEEDMKRVMAHDKIMIGTDGGTVYNLEMYHPRSRATFPRAIGKYVREEKVVPLEEMIRKITSLPAHVYQLKNKGSIKVGYDADLCIFDFETIRDENSFVNPHVRARGLNYVIVGGEIAAENAVQTEARAGRFLPLNGGKQ